MLSPPKTTGQNLTNLAAGLPHVVRVYESNISTEHEDFTTVCHQLHNLIISAEILRLPGTVGVFYVYKLDKFQLEWADDGSPSQLSVLMLLIA